MYMWVACSCQTWADQTTESLISQKFNTFSSKFKITILLFAIFSFSKIMYIVLSWWLSWAFSYYKLHTCNTCYRYFCNVVIWNISRAPNAENEFNMVFTECKVHKYTTTFALKFDFNFTTRWPRLKFLSFIMSIFSSCLKCLVKPILMTQSDFFKYRFPSFLLTSR